MSTISISGCDYLPYDARLNLTNDQLVRIQKQAVNMEQAVLNALDKHQLVGLGDYHWNNEVMISITRTVTSPAVAAKVRHIVVEFGNSRHQAILDRYLSGEDVPSEKLDLIRRDALFFMAWMPDAYGQFFTAVRQFNHGRDHQDQIKVILAEQAFRWDEIKEPKQFRHLADNKTEGFLNRLDPVVKSGKKVVLIFGAFHLLKVPQEVAERSDQPLPMVTRLTQSSPDLVYTIWPLTEPAVTEALTGISPNSVIDASAPDLASVKFIDILPKARHRLAKMNSRDLRLAELTDAVLYVGDTERTEVLPESVFRDQQWMLKMKERLELVGGRAQSAFEDIVENSRKKYSSEG